MPMINKTKPTYNTLKPQKVHKGHKAKGLSQVKRKTNGSKNHKKESSQVNGS